MHLENPEQIQVDFISKSVLTGLKDLLKSCNVNNIKETEGRDNAS